MPRFSTFRLLKRSVAKSPDDIRRCGRLRVRICVKLQSHGGGLPIKQAGYYPDGDWLAGGGDKPMSDQSADAAMAKGRRSRTVSKPAERKAARTDGRTKATLLLPDSVDFRLTTIAASLKSDRSTLATQLIDAGLRRFALDAALRQHSGGEGAAEADRAGE
jgi:hypothetical protein